MVLDQSDQNPGLRFLITLAAAFILTQGLRFAEPILLPVALAGFLAVICLPLVYWLARRRVPLNLAILMTVLAAAGVFGLLILVGSQQLQALQTQILLQIEAIRPHLDSWVQQVESWIPFVGEGELREAFLSVLNVATLTTLATGATTLALSFLSSTFLVFLILVFALGEAAVLPRKLSAISGDALASDKRYRKIVDEVQGYLVIKTLVSLCTGVLLGLWTWVMGLDLPVLFGLIAFILNYVPTIGSIIASVPAIALALVQLDPVTATFVGIDIQGAAIVGLGYVAVNLILGNWIEPTLQGRRLGMSTLVVILSLVFWGWLWGPVGALLSVPLTMVVKIMLENTKDLRWIAVLIDKNPPQDALVRSGNPS
ncbi:MAG: AI-2E family transporter [Gemmatimonadetes bacterium]|nr:AI-2E family transporter [Gemmatimonadota bacterium]MXX70853.1 AI-2E family transporter [Gemmatimonadota bacterium]MYC92019.1 AI-2E family transporter [Gemmatimonadota bacterium]MYG36097.1 AI-2E family transporter [Gemmatimonadota bacterium]MYJ18274.1 AI-2E family transporter [Gemmatimonadota bacterium]